MLDAGDKKITEVRAPECLLSVTSLKGAARHTGKQQKPKATKGEALK